MVSVFIMTECTLHCDINIEIFCGCIAAVVYLQPKALLDRPVTRPRSNTEEVGFTVFKLHF